jgi:2-keto-4-pentenoate hydratase/2-oxohepta-3-ene-1,7-dioic acid hydratase in catechol pathway
MSVYVRYKGYSGPCWGELEDGTLFSLTKEPWNEHVRSATQQDPGQVELLPPVQPGKIVCVGLNYKAHVAESKSATAVPDEPVIFLKPPSALLGPGATIVRPPEVERVDYEAELAVVIGKRLCRPSVEEVRAGIFAATCLNDVTARPLQRKDVQWTRAKGFDTFCPVGPWLITGLELQNLKVQSFVNNQLKQDSHTGEQIWDVVTLIHFISGVMTLEPGDLVSTGTPEGVGPLVAGDQVEVRIEGIGSLKNTVKDAE